MFSFQCCLITKHFSFQPKSADGRMRSPHFCLKVSRHKTTPAHSSSPGAQTSHRCRLYRYSRHRRPAPGPDWDSKQDFSAQLSVGRCCWCCRCVCFGNGSDVNPDLNRNKKPVAEIPWGNQTNVQAPRSITSLGWYSISLCLGVNLNAASCLWFGS